MLPDGQTNRVDDIGHYVFCPHALFNYVQQLGGLETWKCGMIANETPETKWQTTSKLNRTWI